MSTGLAFKVIIVGSGLAGSCLANGLMRANVDVQVYERLAEDTPREGYQIRLGAAALTGLRRCLSSEHLNSIVAKFGRASGLKAQAPVLFSQHFQELLNLTKFSSYSKSAPISRVVLRDILAKPLSDARRLKYSARFSRYEILAPNTTQERVRVWFEDGSYDDCDLLIAADGSHSKVNKQIGLDNIRQVQGHTSILAKSELPTRRFLELPPSLALNPILAFADNKALYFCAYLPKNIDERGKYDETISSSFFGFVVPDAELPTDLAKMDIPKQWVVISRALEGWAPEYHTIVNLLRDRPVHVYKAMYSVEPSKSWRSKVVSRSEPERGHPRVWLVGDAMHAMLPNRGMGGNTALYDTAMVLSHLERFAELGRQHGHVSRFEIEQALKEYEDEMIPRAFGWVKKSGGGNVVPIDTNTIFGILFIRLAAIFLYLAGLWVSAKNTLFPQQYIDDAPELR